MGGTPVNRKEQGCNPVSSNCIVWQGPDIECINLCKGDTISDVVFKLATELCEVLETLKVSSYDLTCLDVCPAPESFTELIQLLIERICTCCNAESSTATEVTATSQVTVGKAFRTTDSKGDTVTTMTVEDYATAIASKLVEAVSELATVKASVANHEERISQLEEDVAAISIPTIPSTLVSDVDTLESTVAQLKAATGEANAIFAAAAQQPAGLNDDDRLGGASGAMSTISGWKTSIQNLSDSFNNIWLTISDLRAAIKNIYAQFPTACSTIKLAMTAEVSGTDLILYITGTIPASFAQCLSTGTKFTIRDTDGNELVQSLDLLATLNDVAGYTIPLGATSLNAALDFDIVGDICLKNSEAECQSVLSYYLANSVAVPSPLTVSALVANELEYSFTQTAAGTFGYVVQLYDSTGATLVASQSETIAMGGTATNSFTGLTAGTTYKMRIKVTSGTKVAYGAFVTQTTLP